MTDNKRNTIAIISNTTWNIYNFRKNILRKLTEKNYIIYVIAPVDQYIHYKDEFPELIHIPLKNLDRDSTNPFKDLALIIELIQIYKKIKPDILLHYTVKPNIYGGFAAGFLSIKSVAIVTGLGYSFIHNGLVKKITKLLYKFSSIFHSKIVFENIDDRELFIKLDIIDSEKGISVKGCGVNTVEFQPIPKINNGKFIFTYIGRLLYDKGIMEFVESAKIIKTRYSNVEFWMIGEIDHSNPAMVKEEDLVSWVKNKTVVYHGFKDNISHYISQSDCIVLPSYREGLPKIILESMSMGKIVITTETAGCREAIEDGVNGFLVPVRSIEKLSAVMEKIINLDPELRKKMGNWGREKAINEFEDKLIANDIYKIISEVLKS